MIKRNLLFVILSLLSSLSLRAQTPTPADAMAFEQQGSLAEAERTWRLITQNTPDDAAAFASLGLVLSKETKYEEAISAYKKALAKLPGIQLNWGIAEFKQGHFHEAIAPLAGALAADPGSAQAGTLLGLSCYGAKQFAEASKYLAVVVKTQPSNTELRKVLAQSCLLAKNYSCAESEFRQIVQQNPDSASAHVLMGEALDGMLSWTLTAKTVNVSRSTFGLNVR